MFQTTNQFLLHVTILNPPDTKKGKRTKNMSQKHVCPCKVLEKSMPQTIDSSSKNDMTSQRHTVLRHKKMTAA